MFKLMDEKIIAILRKLFLLNWPNVTVNNAILQRMSVNELDLKYVNF